RRGIANLPDDLNATILRTAHIPADDCQPGKRGAIVVGGGPLWRYPMKILMVLTSHDALGNTGRKTGFWLEEFVAPYYTFLDAGVTVTVASPKGGQPPLDPKSDLPEGQTALTARFKKDKAAQDVLANTVKLDSVSAE